MPCSILPALRHPTPPYPAADTAGEETVTLYKREFDALSAECASQEVLIAGFQRENEKLIKGVRNREYENTAAKAKFFDQRERLNKEVNRLRNLVGETAHDGETVTDTDPAGDLGPAPGSGSSSPLNARKETLTPFIRKSADVLRAELDKDAFVRHLKERAAIAEAGAGLREKDLQMVSACVRACVCVVVCVHVCNGQRRTSVRFLSTLICVSLINCKAVSCVALMLRRSAQTCLSSASPSTPCISHTWSNGPPEMRPLNPSQSSSSYDSIFHPLSPHEPYCYLLFIHTPLLPAPFPFPSSLFPLSPKPR
jgi:hypothetical protein